MDLDTKKHLYDQIQNLKKDSYDVVLGMSGGVDSTYSLLTFLKEDKKVLGIYLDLFEDKNNTSLKNAKKAEKLAEKFNIDFKIIEMRKYFKEKVQEYFADTYIEGKTPNPCAICNRDVKINILYEISEMLNIPKIATGHYAGIGEFKGSLVIQKGKEPKKEQSYFLSLIPKEFLKKLKFPLQDVIDKEKLRKYLIEENIMTGESSSDSQDICFLQNGQHAEFCKDMFYEKNKKENENENENNNKNKENIDKKLEDLKTKIYLPDNKVYNGKYVFNYTIGQRKGLGISYEEPLYVKDIKDNKVILDTKENMYEKTLKIKSLNLFIPKEKMPEKVEVKIRYSKNEIPSKIKIDEEKKEAEIIFDEKHIKGARGQICAIYSEGFLLGGGIIS